MGESAELFPAAEDLEEIGVGAFAERCPDVAVAAACEPGADGADDALGTGFAFCDAAPDCDEDAVASEGPDCPPAAGLGAAAEAEALAACAEV